MKIYFTCSTAEFSKYKKDYFTIRNYLVEQGHILTRDWLPKTQKRLDDNDVAVNDIKEIYTACIQALHEADMVIIEDTVSNFSTGHQITVALQRSKPTLVLWQGKKHRHFNKTFIHGIDSEYLEVSEYTNDSLYSIIQQFINKYQDSEVKNRFHLVLNNVERTYLDWIQYNRSLSRTKAIRQAIQHQLQNDQEYNQYLQGKKTS